MNAAKWYCPTCDKRYPLTPEWWALFSKRVNHPTRGVLLLDPATGKPKEQMYYVCITCVRARFDEGWAEYARWKASTRRTPQAGSAA